MITKELVERAESAESALKSALLSVEKLYTIADENRDLKRLETLGDVRAKVTTAHSALLELYS